VVLGDVNACIHIKQTTGEGSIVVNLIRVDSSMYIIDLSVISIQLTNMLELQMTVVSVDTLGIEIYMYCKNKKLTCFGL